MSMARAAEGINTSDPIFTRIEEHRAAERAYNAALEADDDRRLPNAEAACNTALAKFLATRPRTVGGVVAALEYASASNNPESERGQTVLEMGLRYSDKATTIQAALAFPKASAETLRGLLQNGSP
jgi:hypothetical protein